MDFVEVSLVVLRSIIFIAGVRSTQTPVVFEPGGVCANRPVVVCVHA